MCQCLGSCSCEGIPFEPAVAGVINQITGITVNADNTITITFTDLSTITTTDSVTVAAVIQAGNLNSQNNAKLATDSVGGGIIAANTLGNEDQAWVQFEATLTPDTGSPLTIVVGPTTVFTHVIPDETVSNVRLQGRLHLSVTSTGLLYVQGDITLAVIGSKIVDMSLQIQEIATTQDITALCTIALSQSSTATFNFSTINYLKHI
jgi:hypothetical protein